MRFGTGGGDAQDERDLALAKSQIRLASDPKMGKQVRWEIRKDLNFEIIAKLVGLAVIIGWILAVSLF